MKHKLITLLSFIWAVGLAYGQNDTDALIKQADSLFQLGQYQQSIPPYQQGSMAFLEKEDWPQYLHTLNQLTESYWRLFDLETASILTDSVINVIETYDRKEEDQFQLLKATALFNKGVIAVYLTKIQEAAQWMEASLVIREKLLESEHPDLLVAYNGVGAVYVHLEELDLALNYMNKVVEADPNSTGPARMNRALIYRVKGEYRRAIDEMLTVLQIQRSAHGEEHPALLQVYSNLATIYAYTRDYEKGVDAALTSLEGKKKFYGEKFPGITQDYTTLATLYDRLADFERSMYYSDLGINLLLDLNSDGRHDGELAIMYANLSNTYVILKQYDSAFLYSKKAENIYDRIEDPMNQATNYMTIGEIYHFKDQPAQAQKFLEKGLHLCLSYLGDRHSITAANYYKLAHFFAEEGDFDKAIHYIDKSIASSIIEGSEYSVQSVPIPSDLVGFLNKKARIYARQYEESDEVQYLYAALEVIESTLGFIKEFRFYYQRYEDKYSFGKDVRATYVSAMEISYLLYQSTGNEKYLEQAFSFSEQSKSQILESHLLDREAKKFSGIAQEVLQAESELNSDWTYYQTEMLKLRSQKSGYDTARFVGFREKLALTNQKKDSINSYLEENHKDYFNLKYREITASAPKFQETLEPGQAFLNYLESDSALHVLVLTSGSKYWVRMANDTTLLQAREAFKNALSFPDGEDFESLIEEFRQPAMRLYDYLLAPVLEQLDVEINRLIISPTDNFSSLPWELFVRPQDTETDDFVSLNYLLKDYSVCYANSASLFQYGLNRKKEFGNNLLAFAPSYAGASPEQYALRNSFRDEFYDLEWNDQEVERIGQHFESNMRIGNQATEGYFKEQAANHRILHLAMHGYVDHEEPMQSKLLFFKDSVVSTTDSLADDGILYAYELFDMDLGAEMTVLSACNTGLGKTRVGEGVMSLARAFLYAGCPSVVMSHWSVDDQATSKLIAAFYKYLADGTSKDQALRNAKLTYLNEANGPYAHPFYWGAFVLNGDPDPLKSDRRLIWMFVVAGIAVLMLFFFIKTRRS